MKKPACKFLMAILSQIVYLLLPTTLCKGDKKVFIGDLCFLLGNHSLAIEHYKNSKSYKNSNYDVLQKIAISYEKIGNLNKSLEILLQLNSLKKDYKISYYLAKIYQKQNIYDKAIEHYKETIDQNPFFVCAYYNWGNILDEIELYDEAIFKFKQALAISPENSEIFVGLSLAQEAKGEYEEACNNLKKAVLFNPHLAEAYFAWGTVLEKMKNYKAAIEKYEQAIDIDPYYSDVYARWGEVLYLTGDIDGAIDKYKTALKIDPEHTWAIYDLACAYVKANNIKEAAKHLVKAIKLDSSIVEEVLNNSNLSKVREIPQIKSLCRSKSRA